MAQAEKQNRVYTEGGMDGNRLVGFVDGIDSYNHPLLLKPTQYRWGENCVNKGALIQTRPGFDTRLTFDITINPFLSWWMDAGNPPIQPQGLWYFEPSNGSAQLVFAVSGSIWNATINSDGSLNTATLLAAAQFNPYAAQVIGESCVQTGTIVSGSYANNIIPRMLLVLQDGINRAAIWDGSIVYTANPQKAYTTDQNGDTLFTNGYNETRIGKWMSWSGNRLWISNGPNVFASDLGDPTHFTEELVLTSGGAWTFPSNVTGLFDRGLSGTTNSEAFVFVKDSTWTLASGVQQRIPDVNTGQGGWIQTPNFQSKIFSAVGCVAGKSVIVHRGLIYWMSADGLVVFDSYGTLFSSQNLPPIDQEMAYSKRLCANDSSTTCAGYFDSYVFWSVPVGNVLGGRPCNGHTQVLDRQTTIVRTIGLNGPYAYGTIGWQGVWTGIRPVEWALATSRDGATPYAFSMDQDGVPRIWESFKGNRCDNGQNIPWTVETRLHPMANSLFETTIFRYASVFLGEILGNLGVTILYRGTRGAFKQIYEGTFTATPGTIFLNLPQFTPLTNDTVNQNNTVQTRVIRTPNIAEPDQVCQSQGIEAPWGDSRDRAFELVFQMTGRAAVIAYRMAGDIAVDKSEGEGVEAAETGWNMVPEGGCPSQIAGPAPIDYIALPSPQNDGLQPVTDLLPSPTLYQAPLPVF